MLKPVRLPPGRARLATRPASTGSPPARRRSGSSRSRLSPRVPQRRRRCHDHVDLAADQIGGQCGQPIIVALRPAVFDRHVLSLDVAGLAQPLAERGQIGADAPGELPLRKPITGIAFCCAAQRAARRLRAAQQEHQLAPPHSMTSSARARILGEICQSEPLCGFEIDGRLQCCSWPGQSGAPQTARGRIYYRHSPASYRGRGRRGILFP